MNKVFKLKNVFYYNIWHKNQVLVLNNAGAAADINLHQSLSYRNAGTTADATADATPDTTVNAKVYTKVNVTACHSG